MNSINEIYNQSFIRDVIKDLQKSNTDPNITITNQGLNGSIDKFIPTSEFHKNHKYFADQMLNYSYISEVLTNRLEDFAEKINTDSSETDLKNLFFNVQESVPSYFDSCHAILDTTFTQINNLISQFHIHAKQNNQNACIDIGEQLKYYIPVEVSLVGQSPALYLCEPNKYTLCLANADIMTTCDAEQNELQYKFSNNQSLEKYELPSLGLIGAYKYAYAQTISRFSQLHYVIAQLAALIDSMYQYQFSFSDTNEPNFNYLADSFSFQGNIAEKINNKWQPKGFNPQLEAIYCPNLLPLFLAKIHDVKNVTLHTDNQHTDYKAATENIIKSSTNEALQEILKDKKQEFESILLKLLQGNKQNP